MTHDHNYGSRGPNSILYASLTYLTYRSAMTDFGSCVAARRNAHRYRGHGVRVLIGLTQS